MNQPDYTHSCACGVTCRNATELELHQAYGHAPRHEVDRSVRFSCQKCLGWFSGAELIDHRQKFHGEEVDITSGPPEEDKKPEQQ